MQEWGEAAADTRRRRVYSVSQLNREIRTMLEGQYASVWIEGEISNYKKHSSGHVYLSLKDDKAQINAVFFSRYQETLKFELKDGLKVLAFGRVSLYEPRGQYQITLTRVEPQGIGALQLAFQQLKERLAAEGLFDAARKKALPPYPETIGIVTSPTGAAIRDILNVLSRRFHGAAIQIYPVRVQGETASTEIAGAVNAMNQLGEADVLIVGRGGGSLEDLWAFNEEKVARAIAASEIPVISAVGHETDWTIADLVADLRAPTPSAAAELVVRDREELLQRIRDFQSRMEQAMRYGIETRRNQLEVLVSSYALKQPQALVQQVSQRVDELIRQLQLGFKRQLTDRRFRLGGLAGRLEALSPLATLSRGYSLTFEASGRILRRARDVKEGDAIMVRLPEGSLDAQVMRVRLSSSKEENHDG